MRMQILNATKSANSLSTEQRLNYFLSWKALTTLYCALIQPTRSLLHQQIYIHADKKNTMKVTKLQKKAYLYLYLYRTKKVVVQWFSTQPSHVCSHMYLCVTIICHWSLYWNHAWIRNLGKANVWGMSWKHPRSVKDVVRYHSGGSVKLNPCILLLAHMVNL
jgi:hypothetical protein